MANLSLYGTRQTPDGLLPVVDDTGQLVGIVTHDDAADAMQAEMTEDFHKASTVLPVSKSMRRAGIRMLYSKRIVWLALLVFGNLFSGAGIALVVGLTMLVLVIFESLIGMSLAFLFNRFRLDPATASGPLVTTMSDAMGVVVYFSIASAVLDL